MLSTCVGMPWKTNTSCAPCVLLVISVACSGVPLIFSHAYKLTAAIRYAKIISCNPICTKAKRLFFLSALIDDCMSSGGVSIVTTRIPEAPRKRQRSRLPFCPLTLISPTCLRPYLLYRRVLKSPLLMIWHCLKEEAMPTMQLLSKCWRLLCLHLLAILLQQQAVQPPPMLASARCSCEHKDVIDAAHSFYSAVLLTVPMLAHEA